MDHLKIFIENSFFWAKDCLISETVISDYSDLEIDEFMCIARQHATHLSDDALRLVHRLYKDHWNHKENKGIFPTDYQLPESSKIFNCILEAASRVLTYDFHSVKVQFNDLFRWRDITRYIGEDVFITSLLALQDCFSSMGQSGIGKRLAYPPTLHNDNTDIEWLMRQGNLHELHTHLRASANVFNINWCCLMNHPENRLSQIQRMLRTLDNGGTSHNSGRINELIVWAAVFRYRAMEFLDGIISQKELIKISNEVNGLSYGYIASGLRSMIEARAVVLGNPKSAGDPDYIQPPQIPSHCQKDFRVYLGERYFLYRSFFHIIRNDDRNFVSCFHKYLLVKSIVRSYLIQLNTNHGFANFQRYQNVKSFFTAGYPVYSRMLESLAVADAWRDSNIAYQEVRIVPDKKLSKTFRELLRTVDNITNELESMKQTAHNGSNREPAFIRKPDFGIIYHFIKSYDNSKIPKKGVMLTPRNHNIRMNLRAQSESVRIIYRNQHRIFTPGFLPVKAIDAASSEFNCRPETFGQAFRFLKKSGLRATYHAGEDYYDIVDGLRAIDEAITFLGMTHGDRIGHAIAMGIDPFEFYQRTENHIVVPAQWMLDNIVWLIFRSADWNITLEPQVDSFLHQKFEELFNKIYGSHGKKSTGDSVVTIKEYYQSLLLRSDNPDCYVGDAVIKKNNAGSDSWENFELLNKPKARQARENIKVCNLYKRYHFDAEVRHEGCKVTELKICKGYASLIKTMQECLMRRLERRHIVIESCPSSNVLIGSLRSFRKHPAFRFHSIGDNEPHHLKVTLNTDDLGVFQTSLANEYSYMALAMAKERDAYGKPVYTPGDIRRWISEVAGNGEKCRF